MSDQSEVYKRAREKIAAGKVVYGDTDIIAFLDHTAKLQAKEDAIKACRLCDAKGKVTETCEYCDGTGELEHDCDHEGGTDEE